MHESWRGRDDEPRPATEVLEHEPAGSSRGLRVLAVVALLVAAVVVVPRLDGGGARPAGGHDSTAEPREAVSQAGPDPAEQPAFRPGDDESILDAPLRIRSIELVAVGAGSLAHGPLDGTDVRTTPLRPAVPSADVAALRYGGGVVVGPAPGTDLPGPVHTLAVPDRAPAEPVAGIVPAYGGTGYWVMGTEPTPAGACVLRLVTDEGVAGRVVTHPCDFVPQRETAAGFVGRVGSRLDPASGQVLDRRVGLLRGLGGTLLDANERQVVTWSRRLDDPIVVTDLVSGQHVDVQLPPGRGTRQVALGADGRYLAVVLVELLITVRSYEVVVHDLVDGDAEVVTVTTLGDSPLELVWEGDVLVVVADGIDVYDAATGGLYRSAREPMPGRLDAVALPGPVDPAG